MTFRLLVPPEPVSAPFAAAIPTLLLAAGSGLVLLERALRGGASLAWPAWIVPFLLIPGLFPLTWSSVALGTALISVVAAGLALRDLVLSDGMAPDVVRGLLTLGIFISLLALTEPLYQRAMARDAAYDLGHAITETDMGRAFLSSNRASATMVNPNVLAGFLLLVLPLAATTRFWKLVPLLAFVAAGSAGALLSLPLGALGLLGVRPKMAPRSRRIVLGGGLVGLAALGLVALFVAIDWRPPLIGSKVETFGHRVRYHALGVRILDRMGLDGAGFESTRHWGREVLRPGEPWSAYLHDGWFQLVIEGGPLLLLGLIWLLWAAVRAARATPVNDPSPPRALASPWRLGLLTSVAAVPFVGSRLATFYPLAWSVPPALDAATNTALAAALWWALGRTKRTRESLRFPLALGLGAFIVHGFLDFDIYIPGAALALASAAALLPGPAGALSRGGRVLVATTGIALLTLPAVLGKLTLDRHDVVLAREALDDDRAPKALALLGRNAFDGIPDLEGIAPVALDLAATEPARAEALLDRLPSRVRERPEARVLEARVLARRTFADPTFAPKAIGRLRALLRGGERATTELLYLLYVIQRTAKDQNAETTLEALRESVRRWNLTPEDTPFLKNVPL